ncbi:ABC transporter [Basidiobolus meristosporus CBS 931.73]|uniref:ABC transporter n=1 Tax=Basidiobolus meristosporus CBS 931.73 TaxID=1314790 RepID=A0A1Y1YYQ3_9FUNG|nr:ABC transporter [Basidiobolus meristosporus CBS 931.73]|eukprot:ORY03173.1 ABC transporter [Basidiobolus meristosporus CBS 931.73]
MLRFASLLLLGTQLHFGVTARKPQLADEGTLFPQPLHLSRDIPQEDAERILKDASPIAVQPSQLLRKQFYSTLQKRSPFQTAEDQCPPCFNCLLPSDTCTQFADCNEYNGRCNCPEGFGGDDCSKPVCNSLADGQDRKVRQGKECQCSDGWGGINCNVCETDQACNSLVPTGQNGTCYKGGLVVFNNYQVCDVTNKKIIDMLPNQPPQVTFNCNANEKTCGFQFWIDQIESFYCTLDHCKFREDHSYDGNATYYTCPNIRCKCMPGQILCGQEGSIDISEFLEEDIEGPASFKCNTKDGCRFEEPAMNDLILSVFGDSYITLDCHSGECLHYTQVPGYVRPEKPKNTPLMIVSIVSVLLFVIGIGVGAVYLARKNKENPSDYLPLDSYNPDDEAGKLMDNHTPATLMFRGVNYLVGKKQVLNNVHGIVKPGQVMAIMGASGAGKTTFLDILARKNKSGLVTGDIYVNGRVVSDSQFKRVVGYVDQEDTLMSTLTVYETILYSALLRLPRNMSLEAKKHRVYETMSELGILGIKDSLIGDSGARGISGGEKRRVSIACELVTSPSILFLDEPTSGLDAYNAYNVIECLVTLARNYNRTVIFTIHQPRSNIFALFDQLVLLADGWMIYSGLASKVRAHFDSIGHPCPLGFNIADFVVDLSKHAVKPPEEDFEDDEELIPGLTTSNSVAEPETSPNPFDDLHPVAAPPEASNPWQTEVSPWAGNNGNPTPSTRDSETIDGMSSHLLMLVREYKRCNMARNIVDEIERIVSASQTDNANLPIIGTYRRSSWYTQYRILSDRTFKNLYRNPYLMLTHYVISVFLAVLCGLLFYQVTNDIAGFQNRMGVFFFVCALFGFGCLTSLQVFASERILFVRERANGYYAPITYFASKVMFDIVPLRVVPPILLGVIIYNMVGLAPGMEHFLKFLLVLVMFNLTAASISLFLGILFKEVSVANLLSSLVMLFSMLFGGLLLNKDSIPSYLTWLKDLSFFNYALEAMLVNEMKYLQLTEKKYGLQIDIPGATILSTFGFNAANFWPDVIKLSSMFCIFIILSFVCLQMFVKEKR